MTNYLPSQFSGIRADELENRGLYQAFRVRGVTIHVARQKVGARSATGEEAELLEIEAADPVLVTATYCVR